MKRKCYYSTSSQTTTYCTIIITLVYYVLRTVVINVCTVRTYASKRCSHNCHNRQVQVSSQKRILQERLELRNLFDFVAFVSCIQNGSSISLDVASPGSYGDYCDACHRRTTRLRGRDLPANFFRSRTSTIWVLHERRLRSWSSPRTLILPVGFP